MPDNYPLHQASVQTGPLSPHKIQALNEEKLQLDPPLSSTAALSKLRHISPRNLKFGHKKPSVSKKLTSQVNNVNTESDSSDGKVPSDKSRKLLNGLVKEVPKSIMKNSQMTEHFPIRRSHRKTKATIIKEKQKEIEEGNLSHEEAKLRETNIQNQIGSKQATVGQKEIDPSLSPAAAFSKLKLSPRKLKFNHKKPVQRKLISQVNNVSTETSDGKVPSAKSCKLLNGYVKPESKSNMRNSKMTDYFPIRRSHRKPKPTINKEKQKEIEEQILSGDEEELEGGFFENEGRGIEATRKFLKGEMLAEFIDDLIDSKEAKNASQVDNLCTESSDGLVSSDKSCKLLNGYVSKESQSNMRNSMKDYLPIRRSHRKPKAIIIKERQKEIEERILSGEEEGLKVKLFGNKGRGIVVTRPFLKGEMVVEYIGDLIDTKEAKQREAKYAQDNSKGCYMYYFTYQETQYCIDATEESTYMGRLVNHSRNGNLVTKTVEVKGRPHLILVAKRNIETGTELLYDYGDRSKQSLQDHPWLAL